MSEKILVVSKDLLQANNVCFQGFKAGTDHVLWNLFAENGVFRERNQMEQDPSYKQLIVYLVLRYRDRIFVYQRIKATGEKRLLDQYSFGLGGHINPVSARSFRKLIISNLNRELKEEVVFPGYYSYGFLGFLNDEQTEVGQHHLGLVFLISCLSDEITVREKNKIQGALIPISQLDDYRPNLENWSCLLLPQIKNIVK
ncbi:MAG: DNA mismatch repair protein MutT [Syntrophomonadaceae bacterium]|nr:hypothetical protein [Thermoanaerobacterales bacterium]NLN20495.1 DNA mismatch repair protein MutT [Syntrophomonadaceae bacterium]HAF17803.1 DNA mismatch repair protein MutT [Peptococcaceae bacterium]